jgi:hypothetical protein
VPSFDAGKAPRRSTSSLDTLHARQQANVTRFIDALMRAVFATGTPTVMENYSAYEAAPLTFATHTDVLKFAEVESSKRAGAVSIAIHYPDMQGRLGITRVSLNPATCQGATYRFCCEGWGVIHAYLPVAMPVGVAPFVSANSEKRAMTWASTYPDWDPPHTWDWQSVSRHLRRLRRALRQVV